VRNKADLANSRFFIVLTGAMMALNAMSIDLYMPSMSHMAAHFEASMASAGLTMSAYFFGAALGQLMGGGFSDQLGRKKIAVAGLSSFTLASALITVATQIEQVQALRMVQGIGGGGTTVVCLAMSRDLYPPQEVARRFASAALIMLQAPLVAPLLGAFLTGFGWQFTFLSLMGYGLVVVILYISSVPETGDPSPDPFSWPALVAGYRGVWEYRYNGRFLARNFFLFSSFNAGVFVCYLTNAAAIYMKHFGLSTYEFGLLFCSNAMMMMTGNRIAHRMLVRVKPVRLVSIANLTQLATVLVIVLTLLWGYDSLSLVLPLMLVVIACSGLISPTMSGTLISFFDRNSGSAASLNATIFMLGGALIGAVAGYASLAFENSILPVFAVILVCLAAGQLALRRLAAIID